MPIPRENAVDWTFWVWLEMFLAGIAAGAYLTAAILELTGRGGSRAARTAHLIAFPLIAVSALILIIDLRLPDRFHHMVVQNNRFPLPMFKPWSPISFGTWIIGAFAAVSFVSFVDALLAVTRRRVGRWGLSSFIHGGPLGVVLAAIGGILAIGVGSYSGLLLQATNFPGWRDTGWLGAEYVATAALTGVAAVILLRPVLARAVVDDTVDVVQLTTYMWTLAVLWIVTTAIFLVTSAAGLRFFFHGAWTAFFVAGAILLALPVVLAIRRRYAALVPLVAALVLVGGLFLRIALVMGPQEL